MILILQHAFNPKEFLTVDPTPYFSHRAGLTIAFEFPISSSRLKKTKPLPFPDAAE